MLETAIFTLCSSCVFSAPPTHHTHCALQVRAKKPFIDKNAEGTAHFHLVHRSQRDPKAADPEAPQRVLIPGELKKNGRGTSERGSQVSSRAWLEEQDLGGFEISPEAEAAALAEAEAMRNPDEFADLGFSEDGYDYGQHLRAIKSDGLFIRALPLDKDGNMPARGSGSGSGSIAGMPKGPGSVAGMSSFSRSSRLSKASIQLRAVSEDAFESAEELNYAVGGALNGQEVADDGIADAAAELEADAHNSP